MLKVSNGVYTWFVEVFRKRRGMQEDVRGSMGKQHPLSRMLMRSCCGETCCFRCSGFGEGVGEGVGDVRSTSDPAVKPMQRYVDPSSTMSSCSMDGILGSNSGVKGEGALRIVISSARLSVNKQLCLRSYRKYISKERIEYRYCYQALTVVGLRCRSCSPYSCDGTSEKGKSCSGLYQPITEYMSIDL